MARVKSKQQAAETRNPAAQKVATKGQPLSSREADLGSLLPVSGELIKRFRVEVDRLFQDFGLGNLTDSLPSAESLGLRMWVPEVEIFERAGKMIVRADLPGLTKDDIKIDLTESSMTIDGERKQEQEESDNGYYRSERSYGRFSRRIPLPEGVDIETAKAEFRDGVLEVAFALPERKERKARKLEIFKQSGSARAKVAGR